MVNILAPVEHSRLRKAEARLEALGIDPKDTAFVGLEGRTLPSSSSVPPADGASRGLRLSDGQPNSVILAQSSPDGQGGAARHTTVRPRFYFNHGLNVRGYDARAALDVHLFEDHVPFYVARAVESGGPVLELGCGTGRVSLAMAEAGLPVTGMEPAAPMLAIARAKRASAAPAVQNRLEFVAGNMTDFDLGRIFPLIIVPFQVFQELLTVCDQRAALRCIRAHLPPGGRLVFDLADPRLEDILVPVEDSPLALPPGGSGRNLA